MESKNPSKEFDAVKMMREIHHRISQETKGMFLEELKKYIEATLRVQCSDL